MKSMRRRLLSSTMIGGALLGAAVGVTPAWAQDAGGEPTAIQEVVITGSRIRRAETTTPAPVAVIDAQSIADRGFVQAGEALNQITSVVPSFGLADGSGDAAGAGQQFPNLFGLGEGRTLTLVNGRRFVTTSSGLGDQVVDTNIIPVGLIQRIDVVQAGGAAVYGSDAVAGVVNYVLKDQFEGAEFDVQTGISSRSDYPKSSVRGTFGRNFLDGRANLAANIEWSQSDSLLDYDRPRTNLGRVTISNPADTGPNDGIPAVVELRNARFWNFNTNGVIYTIPAPVPPFLLSSGGVPQQFGPDGSLIAYDPGAIAGIPFAGGGEGLPYQELASLKAGVERVNLNLIGHFDITDRIKLRGEALYARTEADDPYGTFASNTVLNSAASGSGPIMFNIGNGFLTPTAIGQITALRPGFAFGQPLWVSKVWPDLLPDRSIETTTETYRVFAALEGDFDFADREFYWSVSASRGGTRGNERSWGVDNARFANAINAVSSGGAVVCGINADGDPTNDDSACAPLNPFVNTTDVAARAYVTTPVGEAYTNTQDDFLATIGGDLFELPAGAVKFSLAYEHRREEVDFTPYRANRLGLVVDGSISPATSGSYNTNEFSGEVLVPVFGGDFTLPLVRSLEFNGAWRTVDNSIAGKEDVWGAGLNWEIVEGVALRASKSRNFRAPTLTQLVAPSTTTLGSIGEDPCDADRINSGPNPAVRRANCEALFAANPGYGPLDTFQNPAENFNVTAITTGGNPDLKNEISDTVTYGIVLQPTFAPGLTLIADRVEVDLENGLSAFLPENFLATCFDSTSPSADVCGRFTRDAAGTITAAQSTTFNAGSVRYRGEVYSINYSFPVGRFFDDANYGTLELGVEATHTSLLETSVTGFDLSRTDGTTATPEWVTRFDARYQRGPVRMTYQLFYLPEAKVNRFDTIESTPTPTIDANVRHSVSAAYDFGQYTVRGGVENLTDEEPSYPTRNYGDIIGRYFFVGLNAKF